MKHKSVLLLGLSALATPARAEDPLPVSDPLPPGVFTSAQQSDDWKIKNALSAAPAVIAEKATVMDWPTDPRSHPLDAGGFRRTNGRRQLAGLKLNWEAATVV